MKLSLSTASLTVIALLAAGCAKPDVTKIEQAGIAAGRETAICVLEHPDLFHDPAALAKKCGVFAVEDVVRLLEAHRFAAKAEAKP